MGQRNLANRKDIPADALRQRRDLYVLAIGLCIYNLAGGDIEYGTSFGSILPITLDSPQYLLLAAWIGFFYFWLRFWLVSESKPLKDYLEDARWQLGNIAAVREMARSHAMAKLDGLGNPEPNSLEAHRAEISNPYGPIPSIWRQEKSTYMNLMGITKKNDIGGMQMGSIIGPQNIVLEGKDLRVVRIWWPYALWRAIFRERTFTDYTLPHIFAAVTVATGVRHIGFN